MDAHPGGLCTTNKWLSANKMDGCGNRMCRRADLVGVIVGVVGVDDGCVGTLTAQVVVVACVAA